MLRRLRKYLVFWIVVLAVFLPFAAPVGAFVRALTPPPVAAAAEAEPEAETAAADIEEGLALEIEDMYAQVDVVNVAHVSTEGGAEVYTIQFEIQSPIAGEVYTAMVLDMLHGLNGISTGEEELYWVEALFGNWLVGRLECLPGAYDAEADIPEDACSFTEVNPAAYVGEMVRWPGRPADIAIAQ
jgi:hypothetical protein